MSSALRRFATSPSGLGLLLLGLYLAINQLSRQFSYGQGHLERPIPLLVGLMLAAWGVYGLAVLRVVRRPEAVRLGTVLWFAVLFRLVMVAANVIQEDDLYRYAWDGQVALQGVNPYHVSPATVAAFARHPSTVSASDRPVLQRLHTLAETHDESRTVFARINHPGLRTIYPPVAQAVFTVAQWIAPWDLRSWRLVVLAIDGICVALLLAILAHLKLPASRVLIYAWSPLIVKEFANSGHMDPIPIALTLACLLLVLKRRWIWAAVSLAGAVAAKYYPLVLAPLLARRLWAEERPIRWRAVATFVAVTAGCFVPMLLQWSSFSGTGAYAQFWRLNPGLFGLLEWIGVGAVGAAVGPLIARLTAIVLLLLVVGGALRWLKPVSDPFALTRACLVVLTTIVLLSPVAPPWYVSWVVPLLCIHPSWSLLALTGLVQLYYVGFYVEYHFTDSQANSRWTIIRWAEYAPFFALLTAEVWGRFRHQPALVRRVVMDRNLRKERSIR